MPIYEYICTSCAHEFETLRKMSDAPLSICPACDKSALKKKISAPSFRLSGSGWYETDFKSDKQKNLTNSESSDKDTPKKAADKDTPKKVADKDKAGSTDQATVKKSESTGKKDSAAGKEAAA